MCSSAGARRSRSRRCGSPLLPSRRGRRSGSIPTPCLHCRGRSRHRHPVDVVARHEASDHAERRIGGDYPREGPWCLPPPLVASDARPKRAVPDPARAERALRVFHRPAMLDREHVLRTSVLSAAQTAAGSGIAPPWTDFQSVRQWCRAWSCTDQVAIEREAHELGPGPQLELLEDSGAMRLNRAAGQMELGGDLCARVSKRDQTHDLDLARAE